MKIPTQSTSISIAHRTGSMSGRHVYPSRAAQAFQSVNFGELHFCYGWDWNSGSCKLYLGTKQQCETNMPCWLGEYLNTILPIVQLLKTVSKS
jgi:hypothetical protein